MNRKRTKISGLVSHTTPNSSYPSEESKLQAKFNKGTITKDELRRLASFMVVKRSKPSVGYTEVLIFDKWSSISKLGLDVNMLIKEEFNLR